MNAGTVLRLVVVMILWAACFPLVTVGLDLAPHLVFASLRAAIAGLCLLGIGAIFGRPLPGGVRNWSLVVLAGLGTTSLGFLGMFHAAEFVSPGLATVIANAQPILAALLAHVFLRERLTFAGQLGLLAGFGGIGALAWPGFTAGAGQGYALGAAYVVLAASGVSVGNIAIKRLAGRTDAVMTMGFQLLIGAVPLALLSVATEDVGAFAWTGRFLVVLLVLATLGSALAFWLWFSVLEKVSLNRANAFTFLVPLFGLAIGAALFEERLVWIQVAGVVLVLGGIVLVQRGARSDPQIGRAHV